jgi:hypothetical protein
MFNADALDDFEEGMTQPYAIVCIAEMCEAKKSGLDLPLRWRCFLDPMASNRKVSIGVAGLPCVTCQTDFTSDGWTLEEIRILSDYLRYYGIQYVLTFSFAFSLVRWSLNVRLISAWVAFRPGTVIPFVERAARSIMYLNFTCSRACSGWTEKTKIVNKMILEAPTLRVTLI